LSPSGKTLAVLDDVVRLFDIGDPGRPRQIKVPAPIKLLPADTTENVIGFGPDDDALIAGSVIWDVGNPSAPRKRIVLQDATGNTLAARTLSPDNTVLAVYSSEQLLQVWRVDAPAPARMGPALTDYPGQSLPSLAFSPDSTLLVSADGEKFLKAWDLSDGRHPGQLGPTATAKIAALFVPDQDTLVTAGQPGVTLYDISNLRAVQDKPQQTACRMVGGLTAEEWKTQIPDIEYRKTC
jgi:WD40 repeat protein